MPQCLVHVDAPALRHLRRQRLQVGDDHRRLVDVDGLDRQAFHALGQILLAAEHAPAQAVHIQPRHLRRRLPQVPDDDLVLVDRVRRQRPDHRDAAALGAVAARHVQERPALRLGGVDLVEHRVLLAQPQAEIPQPRLLRLDPPRQRERGAHVRQGIVRVVVVQPVGAREVFELEGRPAVLVCRPDDAVRAQCPGAAQHVHQVPAAALVLPLACIGVDQIAPEQEARHLVVEADRVVAHAHRARAGQLRLDRRREGVLGQAALQAGLRQDAGEQAGFGLGQEVRRGAAVAHHRRVDRVQIGIGAQAGELRRPVAARHRTEGFVVVPEEAELAHAPKITDAAGGGIMQAPPAMPATTRETS